MLYNIFFILLWCGLAMKNTEWKRKKKPEKIGEYGEFIYAEWNITVDEEKKKSNN